MVALTTPHLSLIKHNLQPQKQLITTLQTILVILKMIQPRILCYIFSAIIFVSFLNVEALGPFDVNQEVSKHIKLISDIERFFDNNKYLDAIQYL